MTKSIGRLRGAALATLALALLSAWMARPVLAFTPGTGIQCGDGGCSLITPVPVTLGGTGLNAAAQGDILYGSASNTYSRLTKDTNATRYLANTGTSNNPAWAQVNLTNGVTGALGVPNGGTGAAPGADDQLLVADSTSAATWRAVNDCTGTGKALTYVASSNTFGCNTISGGTTINSLIAFGSGMDMLAGTGDLYFGIGGAFDATEAKVEIPMPAATIGNLRCKSTAAPGGSGIAVTARVGTCGSLADDSTLTVTLTAANTVVADTTGTINVTAGQCLAFEATKTSTTTTTQVGCSVERTA